MAEKAEIGGVLTEKLNERQRIALISLLDDEDPRIYRLVRQKLIELGPGICSELQKHTTKDNQLLSIRAKEIISHFAKEKADNEFLNFCLRHRETSDLEEGVLLLAKTRYTDLNQEYYRNKLDSYAREIRSQIQFTRKGLPIINTINSYLFDKLGFIGNEQDYHNPDNFFLNVVIDKRTGSPITLSILYILISKRLKLPVSGISLPGHFVCRFQTTTEEFYIDVFNRGRILSKADCVRIIHEANHTLQDGYLTPLSPRRILISLCSNLLKIYQMREDLKKVEQFQRYIATLSK